MVLGPFVLYLWWFSVSQRAIYLKPLEASERKEIRARGPNAAFKTLPPVMQQLHHSQWCHRLGTKPSAHGPLGTFMIQGSVRLLYLFPVWSSVALISEIGSRRGNTLGGKLN